MKPIPLSSIELKNVANIYAKGKSGKVLTDREVKLLERYEESTKPQKEKQTEPEKKKNKVGRPRKELSERDKKMIILDLSRGSTVEEVSAMFDVSVQVLYANFRNVIKNGMNKFKCSIKRSQARRAAKGSDTMLIWLGKQYLGQKDHQEPVEKEHPPLEIRILTDSESQPPAELKNDPEA